MSDWQPIASAPMDGSAILIAQRGNPGWIVGEAYYHEQSESWWWANCDPGDYHAREATPLVWQPMPQPPEE